jgi:hypothetical protein
MKAHFVLTYEKPDGAHFAAYDGFEEMDAYRIKTSFFHCAAYVFPVHFYTRDQAEDYIAAVGSDPEGRAFYRVIEHNFKDGRTPMAELSPALVNNDACCFPSPEEIYNVTYGKDRRMKFVNTIRTIYFINEETARQYVNTFNAAAAGHKKQCTAYKQ